jgi:hypothetical protein
VVEQLQQEQTVEEQGVVEFGLQEQLQVKMVEMGL